MKSKYILNKQIKTPELMVFFFIFLVSGGLMAFGSPLAFRGAKGFGKYAQGGRGGSVIVVSDLSDDIKKPKKNTLRWAVEKVKGPRLVVFSKSGYITLQGNLEVKSPFLTIAGHSAPEGGVTIRGASFLVKTHDVVVRYVRFRLGSSKGFIGKCNPDKDDCTVDTLGLSGASNVIFDHISASWSIDEIFSGEDSELVTLQDSILSDALSEPKTLGGQWLHNEQQPHAYCSLYRGSSDISFINNVFANCERRMPQLSPKGDLSVRALIVNNYIYNFDPNEAATSWNSSQPRTIEAQKAQLAIINNFYDLPRGEKVEPITIESLRKMRSLKVFLSGNLGPTRRTLASGDDWQLVAFKELDGERLDRDDVEEHNPFFPIDFEVREAEDLPRELPVFVGASIPTRDQIDISVFERIDSRQRGLIRDESEVGGYPKIAETLGPKDKDLDGMPDAWETMVGSDPARPNANDDLDGDGYTLLDDYLDDLVKGNS